VKIAVIHGPNLVLLGRREPEVYGHETLADVDRALGDLAGDLGVEIETFQSNHEGEIVDFIHRSSSGSGSSPGVDGFLVNPGALTHTSIALRDALLGVAIPFVEVHISNTHAREPFRRHSYLADVAAGVVSGFGVAGYLLGLRGLVGRIAGSGIEPS